MTTTLERAVVREPRLSAVGPNWYASVMATGIVANASATLPVQLPGQHRFGLLVWLLAVLLLAVVTAVTAAHWVQHPVAARGHLRHPVLGSFYGAMPMALLTVGAGTWTFGPDVMGARAALAVSWVLWSAGTAGGLACAVLVPRRAYTGVPFGGWLMPVVPPIVSAATGALLVEQLSPGPARDAMLASCYGMFAVSLLASAVVVWRIGRRVATHGIGPVALVPTLWIVLGPLGQSITAANGLATGAGGTPYAGAAQTFGTVYGLLAWGLAILWLGTVAVVTLQARPAFGLPWWSFTFPVGTVVTGSSALASRTGLAVFTWSAAGLYVGLVAAWAVVGALTTAHARQLLA
ncbi:TDT family transporter [Cellulomonas sp. URHE0023]|uniref:TDT family transporter n=1 Tax=Cellulomonas sp. URHE0023 TaxID=1380354 RepID=UPI00068CEEAD|nr:TDT family transporter [Cellulomonas sp. URHE0023]